MKCRYTFDVTSDLTLNPPLNFMHGELEFRLLNDERRFSSIIVEARGVKMPENAKVKHGPVSGTPTIRIPDDPMLALVQRELRGIRGALSLWGVLDINTDHPKIEWMPETPEEQEGLDVYGVSISYSERGKGTLRDGRLDMLVRTIMSRSAFGVHEIPFEFHRRGAEDVFDQRFIEGIYDFYFVIEYLFADGKFNRAGSKEAFIRSSELKAAVNEALRDPFPELAPGGVLHEVFKQKYLSANYEQICETIIQTRGFLHHQSLKRKQKWNPGVQSEFKVDALFLNKVSHSAVMKYALEILFDPIQMEAIITTPVFSNTGQRINWVPCHY